jgi:AcrR family transcriptional regulator
MFKMKNLQASKSDQTREHLLTVALGLFRKKGFDRTTMRDIAGAARMSLGASYYYFRAKEELVLAYYQSLQDAHQAPVRNAPREHTLQARLEHAFHSKLDLIEHDRRFLSALFRYAADPQHPLSVFSRETLGLRQKSQETFRLALAGAGLDEETNEVMVDLAWLAHLALILYALHDDSSHLQNTRRFATLLSGLAATVVGFLQTPGLAAVVTQMVASLTPLLQSFTRKHQGSTPARRIKHEHN